MSPWSSLPLEASPGNEPALKGEGGTRVPFRRFSSRSERRPYKCPDVPIPSPSLSLSFQITADFDTTIPSHLTVFSAKTPTLSINMSAPTGTPAAAAPHQAGLLQDKDADEWKNRFTDVLARPSEHLNSKSPDSAQSWMSSLFACFMPIDTCLVTCCVPCVTFGKTHHRLRKDPNLEGYSPINTSVCCSVVNAAGRRSFANTQPVPPPLRNRVRVPVFHPRRHAARRYPGQVQPSGQLHHRYPHRLLLRLLRSDSARQGGCAPGAGRCCCSGPVPGHRRHDNAPEAVDGVLSCGFGLRLGK